MINGVIHGDSGNLKGFFNTETIKFNPYIFPWELVIGGVGANLNEALIQKGNYFRLSSPQSDEVYGGYNGYTVRSVYHPDDRTAKFELKRKSFGRELKESIVISREDAKQILNKNYSVLLKYQSPISEYACQLMTTRLYRPVSLIEYDRRAFTHENFRAFSDGKNLCICGR